MRYIDADALLNNLPDDLPYKASVKRVLIQAPTENVVEVRHGEWETMPDCQPNRLLAYRHICSECKNTYKDLNCRGHNYCHWCGAKMDGERREENER